jgi:hypothetical protein
MHELSRDYGKNGLLPVHGMKVLALVYQPGQEVLAPANAFTGLPSEIW